MPWVLVTDARVVMLIRTMGVLQVDSIPWSGSFGGPDDGPLVAELDEVVVAFFVFSYFNVFHCIREVDGDIITCMMCSYAMIYLMCLCAR
jgi:hypothetical protein